MLIVHNILQLNRKYSSYDVKVGKDGYVRYNANDPKVLVTEKNLDLESHKKGFFGGTQSVDKTESMRKEYTMFNESNGGPDTEGKLTAEKLSVYQVGRFWRVNRCECMTGGLAPVLTYLIIAAGWATMLGSKVGSDLVERSQNLSVDKYKVISSKK